MPPCTFQRPTEIRRFDYLVFKTREALDIDIDIDALLTDD